MWLILIPLFCLFVWVIYILKPRLILVQAGNREITISCSPSIFYTNYKLYYKQASNSDESLRQIIFTTSSTGKLHRVLTQLTNGESYHLYLKARRRWTNLENQVAHIQVTPMLTPPVNFQAIAGDESATIVLSWSPVPNATGYEIQRASGFIGIRKFTTITTISSGQTTTYSDKSNLVNGKTYIYRIAAIDSRSTSTFSSNVSAIPQLAPPVNFQAIAGDESANIVLSWSPVLKATGYAIQRASGVHDIRKFTVSSGQTTAYIDKSDLLNGNTYIYRIAATDSWSTSAFSPIVSALPQLAPPVNFQAIAGDESATIVLSWSPMPNATGYEIQRTSGINHVRKFTVSSGRTTAYSDKSDIVNGETYSYRIAAIDTRLRGRLSSDVSAIAQLAPPANFEAKTGEESATIVLSWSPVPNATGYKIKRASGVNDIMKFTVASGQATTCTDKSDIVNGETYSYRIAAIDSRLRGRFSSNVSVISQLTPPANFEAKTGQGSATIVLSWSPVSNATGYEIQRALGVNDIKKFTTIAIISNGQTTAYSDKSCLLNGKTYSYRIAAIDRRLISIFSSIVSAIAQLAAPSNFSAFFNQASISIDLSWSPVPNATGYEIQRVLSTNNMENFSTIATISNGQRMTYIDKSDLTNGKSYKYRIASIDNRAKNESSIWSLWKDTVLKSPYSSVIQVTLSLVLPTNSKAISVRKGDLAKENVDAIVVCSSSEVLRKAILVAAGPTIETAYANAQKANSLNGIISTSAGQLPCQKIFFLPWSPNSDLSILKQSLKDFINNAIQHAINHDFRSIAFPAVGCGKYGCSIDVVAETMVSEAINPLEISNYSLEVVFVLPPDREDLYNTFIEQKEKFELIHGESTLLNHYGLPSNWERSIKPDQILFTVSMASTEYNIVIDQFKATIKPYSPTIVHLIRIQNERWYKQYKVHEEDFRKLLNKDTVRTLYHGCSEDSAKDIISQGFNRSFAGVNGIAYGIGVYFAAGAHYSHSFTRVNSTGERCMFVAKVLIGNSTLGNSSMKVCPVGYDSTTDGRSIFVAYHDAQSYAEYLITYV